MVEEENVPREQEDRREFLQKCGKFALVTPPVVSAMLTLSLGSTSAVASVGPGGGSGGGSGGGTPTGGGRWREYFETHPDAYHRLVAFLEKLLGKLKSWSI